MSIAELFYAKTQARQARFFSPSKRQPKLHPRHRRFSLEPLEPRVLLSANLLPQASTALALGLDQFGTRIDDFLDAQNVLNDTRIPFVVQVQQGADGAKNVAPTLGSLFSLQVDTNGAQPGGTDLTLQGLDKDGSGAVDAGEFIQGWLISAAKDQLALYPDGDATADTTQFVDFLKGIDTKLTFAQSAGQDVTVELKVNDAKDLTESDPLIPPADLLFGVDFTLTATQDLAIDLGTEADALKLLSYTGNINNKTSPMIPVDAKLDFDFTFGVHTSGQTGSGQSLDDADFFVRDAGTLNISAESHVKASDNFDFNLNIGFLGATVNDATVDFQAMVKTLLIDPDSPEVLGFTTSQYGAEQTSGTVTSFNAIPSADLAHDAGFVLRIGNAGIATEVKVLDDNNNGTNLDNLVADVNGALGTAGLGNLVTASLSGSQIQFSLVQTTDTPLGFANESYSGSGVLSADPGGFEFTSDRTFLLSVDGALPTLVDVRFPDPAKSDIGFDSNQTATLPDLVATNAPTQYDLTGVAVLNISITKSDGTSVWGLFGISDTDTDGNANYADLAADINAVLATPVFGSALNGLIQAVYDGSKIRLQPIDASVSAIDLSALGTATSEIGFADHQISTLTLTAVNPVSNPSLDDGKPATNDDAHIEVTVTTKPDVSLIPTTKLVVVIPGSANGTDLATAINGALHAQSFAIDASYDGSEIVLTAQDASVLAFSISTINNDINDLVDDVNRALKQVGVDSAVTASVDGTNLKLTAAAGKSLEITQTLTLDAGDTYQELVDTPTDKLFKPEIDPTSNITFDLPVHVTAGLNYDPHDVAIVGNFSPFGETLYGSYDPITNKPVAVYDASAERFKLNMTKTPTIDGQDTPVGPETVAPAEHLDLVNMAEPLNFNLVTAESMVGLIKGLGTALQQMADSGLFANYDIPFAKVAWSDLLNYTDSNNFSGLIDRSLIYETGLDGIDASGAVSPDDANKLLLRVVDTKGTPDTKDDVVYLVPAFVTAQDMAKTLSSILGVALTGAGGINANYDPKPVFAGDPPVALDPTKGVNELTYTVDLVSNGRTDVSLDKAAFEYDVALSPFAKLTLNASAADANKEVTLQGYTGLSMTFGINLSPPGAVIDEGTDVADVNGGAGVDIKTEVAVTGEAGVRSVLSGTASIGVTVSNGGGDTFAWVTVTPAGTSTNKTTQDFADDLNTAINGTALNGKVVAGVKDGKLFLKAVDVGSTLKVNASSEKDASGKNFINPAWTELGFSPFIMQGTTVEAVKAPTPAVGRLTDDATFWVDIAGDPNGPYQVTVKASDTAGTTIINNVVVDIGNVTIGDLVSDVNNALAATDIGDELGFQAEQTSASDTLDAAFVARLALTHSASVTVQINSETPATFSVAGGLYATLADLIEATNAGLTSSALNGKVVAEASGTHVRLRVVEPGVTVTKLTVKVADSASLRSLIKADFDSASAEGTRLVLTALDSTTQFSVTAGGTAHSELGLPVAANANQADFVIVDSRGGVYQVPLDNLTGVPEVKDLLARINAVTGTAKAELGFGDTQTAATPDLVAQNGPTQYALTGDATFTISVTKSDGTVSAGTFILTAADTAGNTSYDDLASDISTKLMTPQPGGVALNSLIRVVFDGTNMRIQPVDESVRAISVLASGTALTEVGLGASQMTTLALTAVNTPSTFNLTYDAHFMLSIARGGIGTDVEVTVPADANADAAGLAADINAAVDAAVGVDVLDVLVDSAGKFVLKAKDTSVYSLSIGTKMVTADFNATRTGLRLVDNTGGLGQFRVETVNGSKALVTLGLFGAGNTGTQNKFGTGNPYLIEGGQIGLMHLDDRFFVRDAQLWGAVGLQTPAATATTPAGILGSGLFGIVGVDTNLQGSIYAQMTADIKDPDTGVAGGTATLRDLFEGTKQGRLTEDATFTVKIDGSSIGVDVTVLKAATLDDPSTPDVDETNNTLADLVADVNAALAIAHLNTQIKAQAAGTRIEFASLNDPATLADESKTPFTITAGVNAAQLGLSGTLNSTDVKGVQTIDAHSAPRYAVEDPVVSKVSELAFSGGFGSFVPGTTVYGWADTDADDLVDTLTGSALVLGTEGSSLIVAQVKGTFAGTLALLDVNDLSTFPSVALTSSGSDATSRAIFGHFTLGTDVQSGFGDLAFVDGDSTHGFGLLDGKHCDVGFALTDFGNPFGNGSPADPTAPVATFDDLAGDTGDLYAFKDLGYGDIDAALQQLLALIGDVNDNFALLNTDLPAINRSVSDLLSLVGSFDRGVTNADDAFAAAILALSPEGTDVPALTLQNIPRALRSAFGLPSGPDTVDPSAADAVNWIKLDFDKAHHMLLMDLSLEQTISTKLGLDIELLDADGNPLLDADGHPLPNLTSAGVLKVKGALDVNLNVGIDLNAPSDAYLFDTSTITGNLHVEGEGQTYESGGVIHDGMGLVFRAALGPLAVFIQDGDATIDAAFTLGLQTFGKKLITTVDADRTDDVLADFKTPEITENYLEIMLPMFYGGEGPDNYLGDFSATGYVADDPSTPAVERMTASTPDFSPLVADIANGVGNPDPFDNILLAFDTLNVYLETLSDTIAGDVLGTNLPFVGDQLADLLFIETFRNKLYTTLKNGIENDINPTPEDVTDLLNTALAGFLKVGTSVGYAPSVSGNVSTWSRQWSFELYKDKNYTFDNFDLGISNLEFDMDVPVQVNFVWDFNITFGVNFTEGAYIDVSNADELAMDATITLPQDGPATLGFLKGNATDAANDTDPGHDTGAVVNFDVDVTNGGTAATHLGFSDLGSITADARVKGSPLTNAADANADGVKDAVTLHLVTTAVKGLPSLTTDLVMDWSLDEGTRVKDLKGDAVTLGTHLMALDNMSLDAKSVAQSLLGPIFDQIEEIIQPFMPLVDTLTYPIPILSDVAGKPFTLLDLAAIFGSVDPAFIDAVKDILNVIKTIDNITELPVLPLGSLTLFSGTIQNLKPNDPAFSLEKILVDGWDPSAPPAGWSFDKAAFDAKIESNGFLKDLRDGNLAKGLSMPVFTDARQGVKLLLDQNATMIDYLIPPLSVDFSYLQVFPIFGPLSLSIEINFGFDLELHSVGFDTYGYQRYARGGFRDTGVIFDGFYLNDLNAEGVDAPEITFSFGLVGAAELNLGIARAGVEGGINAKIFFDWYDAVPDGHVHYSELAGSVLANGGDPLAVFDVSGALTFQMLAFLEISLIGFKQDFPITPEITLYSFDVDFDRPPILATTVLNADGTNTLILNTGPNSKDRLNGDTSDGNENINVTYDEGSGDVYVYSDAFGVDSGDPANTFSNVSKIVGLGGEGDDTFTLALGTSHITYDLDGGAGDDTLTVTGGGDGTIHGRVGNDTLAGGAGDDKIWGEEGNDTIDGGDGADILFGDFGRVFENMATADPLVTSRVTDADGADQLHGGAGADILIGAGGNDKLWGDAGDDVLIGDGGRFAYEKVGGHFAITAITQTDAWKDPDDPTHTKFVYPYVPETVDTPTPTDPATISKNIDKIYDAVMATFSSTDLGVGGKDTISGGDNDDIILGGTGDDTINGDAGADIILGGKGFDDIHGGAGDDTIFGGDQADVISGDADNDVISGGTGNDYLHGNTGNDVMKGDSGADVMFGDENNDQVFGQTEPDILFGGAGDDLVVGGTGDDVMFGDDGVVAKLNHSDGSGYKVIYNDTLIGESGVAGLLTTVIGEEGNFSDNDTRSRDLILTYVTPKDGNDLISGDAGQDYMFGGGGNDRMGGDVDPRLPEMPKKDGVTLATPVSQDVMIGDGGMMTFDLRQFRSISTVIADTSGWPDLPAGEVYEFNDIIYGDNGNDYIFGGQGSDFLFGGHGKVVTAGAVGAFRGATDASASDNDVIVGDNGRMNFGDSSYKTPSNDQFGDLKQIKTTDTSNDTGGHEYVEGELGNDVIFGGVNASNDLLFGNMGDDVILGDNGELDFDFNDLAHNLATLDLISSYRDGWGDTDEISGVQGNDVLIGGTGGDLMYGDDATASSGAADGEDIMLGDNGDLFLIGAVGRLTVQVAAMPAGTAVDLITTTDAIDAAHPTKALAEACGGPDNMSGNAMADIMLGGVNNDDGIPLNGVEKDVMYGDAATPSNALDGNDILLGDDGLLDFTYNPADYPADDQTVTPDTERMTLDLIRSTTDGLGGRDTISGNAGSDVAIGGTGGDTIYGDNETATATDLDLGDILVGDNADVFTKGPYNGPALLKALGTGVALITTTDTTEATGGVDTISGNAAADVILGGVAGDTLYGDAAAPVNDLDSDDVLLGDDGKLDFAADLDLNLTPRAPYYDLMTLDLIESFTDGLGGVDTISGNAGADTVTGGTAGDTIYGDNESASGGDTDKNDMLLGDNGVVLLVDPALDTSVDGGDRILILGGAAASVRSTDEPSKGPDQSVSSDTGGVDTISGNAGSDIVLGGVAGDTLYGDRASVTEETNALDGRDTLLGDNGALEWLSTGRLGEIVGVDVAAQNPDLVDGFASRDTNLDTVDLVTTEQPTSGGRDTIYGDNARDVIFGGTDADTLYGDTGSETDGIQSSNGNDLMFGDHGRLYPQFSRFMVNNTLVPSNDIYARNFFAIDIGDTDDGEGDRMWGEEGADIMLGQQGDDRMWGGSGDDDMTGGHNVSGGFDELTTTTIAASLDGSGIATPAIDDVNDLMDGGTGNDSMAGDNTIIWRRGDDLSPRFRALTAAAMYTTTPDTIVTNVGADSQSDPADAVGRDIQLIDHADGTPQGLYGADVMAGNADIDTMFGELGNDLMQGDGSIAESVVASPFLNYKIGVEDTGTTLPDTDQTLYFNIPEQASDADDYMEGNGGNDLMYGGLGQDDMLGGSSALFGLITEQMRPDGSDVIFGGAGIDISRGDMGDAVLNTVAKADGSNNYIETTPTGHARDADFIMGDNANVYRLVHGGASGTNPTDAKDVYLTFNYDNYSTALKIVPRAMQQLDYTLGGGDYAGGGYNLNGQATPTGKPADNGAADLIHGESGDDIIFGMTGSDVIFGEGQDDDIVGGYGNDWISGGTGQDGVLGDDGLIYTSRNSTAGEPLYGVAGLLSTDPHPKYSDGYVLDEVISTPGQIQFAVINKSGELKKAMDLVPFSYDHGWIANDDEFPNNDDNTPFADDIIFGGLGSDWLHGGSGDDAVSGAEALPHAYVPVFAPPADPTNPNEVPVTVGVLDLGYVAVGFPATVNPGDVLAFNPVDLNGRHLNNRFRAGEFYLYDEYSPLHKILLNGDGTLWDPATQPTPAPNEFLLNFNKDEGVFRASGTVPKATGQQTETYPAVNDDGTDAIFGDNGNDWLVGGTGADDVYGGWGNDLINADDDQTTLGTDGVTVGANDKPDTHPYYQDRAYGGAGRDVLIANTGGDRLIDWVGEYNSYLVPYAPFGEASVSRTMQPFLPEFLYALSASDGADPTRYADENGGNQPPAPTSNNPNPGRNGEPHGELGLVLQKDFAWQDQTGAPSDPQAGNIPGGPRDVLRSAGFNDGTAQGFFVDNGKWAVTGGRYQVEPLTKGADAVSVFYVDEYIPSYFEMLATINAVKPTGGYNANAYLIFDYQTSTDFKFAGINVSTNKLEIGYRDASGWHVTVQKPYTTQLKSDTDYNVFLALNGTNVILTVNNQATLTYTFDAMVDAYGISHGLKDGMVGLGANNGKAAIDNVTVQRVAPVTTVNKTVDFSSGTTGLLQAPMSGSWSLAAGRYVGTAGTAPAIDLTSVNVTSSSLIDFSATFKASGEGGFVYDQYSADDFKYVTLSAGKITLGHRTAKGWFTDAVYNNAGLLGGTDYTLGLTLKGTAVSVTLNGQTVLSRVYNALATDGNFGLFSRSGITSFDTVTFKSDDPSLTNAAFLLASAPAQGVEFGLTLSADALAPIVNQAISGWTLTIGATEAAALDGITIMAADLPDEMLGETLGATILIDQDAAGYGWFVDSTAAGGRMDLLTVVSHELGHVFGYTDLDPVTHPGNLMSATLDAGTRRSLEAMGASQAPGTTETLGSLSPTLAASLTGTAGTTTHRAVTDPLDLEVLSLPLAWNPVSGSLMTLDSPEPLAGITSFLPASGSVGSGNGASRAAQDSQLINWTAEYSASAASVRSFNTGTRKSDQGKSAVEFELALSLDMPTDRAISEDEDLIFG